MKSNINSDNINTPINGVYPADVGLLKSYPKLEVVELFIEISSQINSIQPSTLKEILTKRLDEKYYDYDEKLKLYLDRICLNSCRNGLNLNASKRVLSAL